MLSQSLKVRSITAPAADGVKEVLRLGVATKGDSKYVQAFRGTRLVGESQPYPANDPGSPAADIEQAFGTLLEMKLKICVGEPKAHWKGEAYVAPRAGQSNEFDAGEWYAELFGEAEEAAIALAELAEIGFWEPDKSAECLRFSPDATRSAASLSLAERIAAVEARSAANAETRTSNRRMRY